MNKTIKDVLTEWAQDLLERHPDIELAICQAKVDLWHGPVEGQLSFPYLVDKVREWADENVPGTLWIDIQCECWQESEPEWEWGEDGHMGPNPEDFIRIERSLLMQVLLGDLARYI